MICCWLRLNGSLMKRALFITSHYPAYRQVGEVESSAGRLASRDKTDIARPRPEVAFRWDEVPRRDLQSKTKSISAAGRSISALGKLKLGIRQPFISRNCNSPSFHTVEVRLLKDRQKSQEVWLNARTISALGRLIHSFLLTNIF